MDVQIGKVTHYYDKIGVAVIEVTKQQLTVGDKIKFIGHDKELEQTVQSLQIEHKEMNIVKKGQTAGLKVDQPVKPSDIVYLITDK